MGFQSLKLKSAYDTGVDGVNVVRDFYLPVLSEAVQYDRAAGYFSSTALALAARGITGLIRSGGKIRIVTSPDLTRVDLEVLQRVESDGSYLDLVENEFTRAIEDPSSLTSLFERKHLQALSWMLKSQRLEIRVVVPTNLTERGMFHLKVGVLHDAAGDIITFSGSNNESAGGWVRNIEEFKVFRSWLTGVQDFVQHDRDIFDRYWELGEGNGFVTIELPRAVREKLVSVAPDDIELLLDEIETFDISQVSTVMPLREYQKDAIEAWLNANCHGVLEMATGTGKTRTARECILKTVHRETSSTTLIVVPQVHLATQWAEVLDDLNPTLAFGGEDWKAELSMLQAQVRLNLVNHVVVIAVQNTASSQAFRAEMEVLIRRTKDSLIVVDEAHGTGSQIFRSALDESYSKRLGLSATPRRWFDDEGTEAIMNFFGGVVYTFGIHEALNWIDPLTGETPLCPYNYYPEFASLDDLEMEQYAKLSRQITQASRFQETREDGENIELLRIRRSRIIKKARSKIDETERILSQLVDRSGTLIYCADTEQLELVAERLNKNGILYRRFTGEEGSHPSPEFGGLSERSWILNDFVAGRVEVLLAVKCLDEGIDIPSTKRGIILASSTNPKEFIQRRGRLLRRSPGKSHADVYDLMVVPRAGAIEDQISRTDEVKILRRELARVEEFALDAMNFGEISAAILEKTTEVLGER